MPTPDQAIKHINTAFTWWVDTFYNGSQSKAAEALGISRSSISGFMNSDSANPSTLVFMKAFELHSDKINESWWLKGEGTPEKMERDSEMEELRSQVSKLKGVLSDIQSEIMSRSKNLF